MRCPKCSYEPTMAEMQRSSTDCVRCGANYATYRAPTAAQRLARGMKGAKAAVAEGRAKRSANLYCPHCGSVSGGISHTRGSMLVELILWLCFLAPGIIYSVWRISSRQTVCPSCFSPDVIPVDSPRARRELGRG